MVCNGDCKTKKTKTGVFQLKFLISHSAPSTDYENRVVFREVSESSVSLGNFYLRSSLCSFLPLQEILWSLGTLG